MRIHIAVALAVLTFGGCSKGGNGVTGTGSGTIVAAGGNFVNAGFAAPTILRCDLLLDGGVIATQTNATAGSCSGLVGSATIGNGSHTLAFRITNQTSSPNAYETIGALVGTQTSTKFLEDQTQTLATGQSISYTFSWP